MMPQTPTDGEVAFVMQHRKRQGADRVYGPPLLFSLIKYR